MTIQNKVAKKQSNTLIKNT